MRTATAPSDTVHATCLRVLADGAPHSYDELERACIRNGHSASAPSRTLSAMVTGGQVERVARATYRLPRTVLGSENGTHPPRRKAL